MKAAPFLPVWAVVLIGVPAPVALAVEPPAAAGSGRFGDSTWVAPYPVATSDGDIADEGPRVAEPDRVPLGETLLRLPFRVAFFPLRLLAMGGEKIAGPVARHVPKDPRATIRPTLRISSGGGLAPGIRIKHDRGSWKRTLLASWSVNDHRKLSLLQAFGKDGARVRGGLDATYVYKPNVRFYGIGDASSRERRAIYLEEETGLEASLQIGKHPVREILGFAGVSLIDVGRGYNGGPFVVSEYQPADNVPFLGRGSRVAFFGVRVNYAGLDDRRAPARGLHARAEGRRAQGLGKEDLAYDRWHLEGRGYLPIFAGRRVLALRALYQGVAPAAGSDAEVPYYRLPMSEDPARFSAYPTGRFRDRQLVLARAEYRWQIWEAVWALGLVEGGEVAPRASALSTDRLHGSYGGGLRFASEDGATVRFEAATGSEGFRFHLDLGGDF